MAGVDNLVRLGTDSQQASCAGSMALWVKPAGPSRMPGRQPGRRGTATPSMGSARTAITARTHPASRGISKRLKVNPLAANWSWSQPLNSRRAATAHISSYSSGQPTRFRLWQKRMNSATSGGGGSAGGPPGIGRADDGVDRSDMAGRASKWQERNEFSQETDDSAGPRIGVGAEYYWSRARLRRGSVHQLIHIRFHTRGIGWTRARLTVERSGRDAW